VPSESERLKLSRYRQLVERYVNLARWTTAKKSGLVLTLLVPSQLAIYAICVFIVTDQTTSGLNFALTHSLFVTWNTAIVMSCLIVWPVALRGKEGRRTAYLLVTVEIAGITWLYHLLGTMTNPILSWYPMAVVLASLVFDVRIGVYCLVLSTTLLIAVCGLELVGALPYAPAVVDRVIDEQVNLPQYLGKFLSVAGVFTFVVVLVQMSSTARSIQEQKLEQANQQLDESNQRLEQGSQLISRYAPPQVAKRLLAGEHDYGERPERRKLTAFFSDIEGFTPLAEEMEPEDLTALLNSYLTEMSNIVEAYGGTLTQFVGDGLMILFGAPASNVSEREHALNAVRMGLTMQERMLELQDNWFLEGIETTFRIRVGINTGMMNVGNFGSAGRMTYCSIGTQTNLAARIQAACEPGKVLISHSTWALVKDDVEWSPEGKLNVKGVHRPIQVYEVCSGFS